MKSKEALKRIRQETAPATYMPDFNKEECCEAIEKDLEVLEILKNNLHIEVDHKPADWLNNKYFIFIRNSEDEEELGDEADLIYIIVETEKANAIKEWLKGE